MYLTNINKPRNVWSFQLLAAWRVSCALSLSPFAWAVGSCRPAARSQPGWSSQNLSKGINQWGSFHQRSRLQLSNDQTKEKDPIGNDQ